MRAVYVTRDASAEPGAAAVLARLGDAGLEVVVVDGDTAAAAVEDAANSGWLITDDPRTCGRRSATVRTILVGPRRPPSRGPAVRCDLEARDLSAAVLEILTHEAMG
jgi:streptomycin 6-kinase